MAPLRQISSNHIAEQRRLEAEWRNKIFWALRRSKRPFFEMIDRGGLDMAIKFGYNLIDQNPIRNVLERLYYDIGSKGAAEAYVSKGFEASASWLAIVEQWFSQFITNLTSDINETTWKYISAIIEKGIKAGTSYADIIRELRGTGTDKRRASLIARTETNRTLGWAKFIASGKLPYAVSLVWVAATDRRTRGTNQKDKADHRHMDGQMVDYGQPFIDPRNGTKMQYPGDTLNGAGPGDVCNCRCTLVTRRKR